MQRKVNYHVSVLAIALGAMAVICGVLPISAAHAQATEPAVAGAGTQSALAQAVRIQPSQDTTIDNYFPKSPAGTTAELLVSYNADNTTQLVRERAALLQFDLSAIPEGSTIVRAELGLFQRSSQQPQAMNLAVRQVITPWDNATTWETRPSATTFIPSWPMAKSDGGYITVEVTSLVDAWVNAPFNTPNYGFELTTQDRGDRVDFDSVEGRFKPYLAVEFSLPPIRVCYDQIDSCLPVDGATVFDLARPGQSYATDTNGRVLDDGAIQLGDELFARVPSEPIHPGLTQYCIVRQAVAVVAANFVPADPSTELRMAVDCSTPVALQDLVVSSQSYVEDDPARVEWLRANIIRASDYLYDFTDGRFALGTVRVRQNGEGWDALGTTNLRLYTSNTLHPNANIGGIVTGETPDIAPTVTLSYTPGYVSMGSYWNRFGTPPNQVNIYQGSPVPPETLSDDWAIALAHELGHYLFFLFDTYTDKDGKSSEAIAAQCTGSAMGNAYALQNHAFINDLTHWTAACNQTEAYHRLNGRTEWATIAGWYPFVSVPATVEPGVFPAGPLTTVLFEAPAVIPPPLAASQIFSLTYQAGQTSSGEARAFLLRDDSRIFEQGKPAKNTIFVALTDARLGDRLCVYDINDHAESPDTPRHQFGCEVITAGDAELAMTLNPAWRPQVTMTQIAAQTLRVRVQQGLPAGTTLSGRLIPESGDAFAPQTFALVGGAWQADFVLPVAVPPVYLQVWVDEMPAAPATRREVMADRGTGGNGAFGPAKLYGGVMVVSSDGKASYQGPDGQPLELGPGDSIAWQSMPGTPPLPPRTWISGQSYRLDAFPAMLVNGGTVNIQFADEFAGVQAASRAAAATAIYFWDGAAWTALPTTVGTPADAVDGVRLASAPSQGIGIYAVLQESAASLYLPAIGRQ